MLLKNSISSNNASVIFAKPATLLKFETYATFVRIFSRPNIFRKKKDLDIFKFFLWDNRNLADPSKNFVLLFISSQKGH